MSFFSRLLFLVFLVAMSLLSIGCDSRSESVFTEEAGVTQRNLALGRLRLDVPISGASVTVVNSATGATSSPAITNASGFFEVDVPSEGKFTVRATVNVDGVDEVYQRCYDKPTESLHINALTTLAARYRELHPELSAEAAEVRVKEALGMPSALDIGSGGHAHAITNFSHSRFLREARAYPGGQTAYVDAVLTDIDLPARVLAQGEGSGILLQGGGNDDLSASAQAFEELLQRFVREGQNDVTQDTTSGLAASASSFTDASSIVATDARKNLGNLANAAEGAGAKAAESAAKSLLKSGLKFVGTKAFGFLIQFALSAIFPKGPNPEILQELDNINNSIAKLQTSVDQLSAFIDSAFLKSEYETSAGFLAGPLVTIDTSWKGPDNNGNGYSSVLTHAAGQDFDSALAAAQDILPNGSNYQTIPTLADAQTQISDAQLGNLPNGTPSLMKQFRDVVSPTTKGSGYRYCSNLTINQMYGQWSQLATYQMNAAQVIAALYRAGGNEGPPDFTGATNTIKATNDQIQQQYSQLPFPLPDDKIIFDTTSGLVLWGELFAPVPIGQSLDYTGRLGMWPYPQPGYSQDFPYSGTPGLNFGLFGGLPTDPPSWVLPTAGMLWTFMGDGTTRYFGGYTTQPASLEMDLNTLLEYGFTIDSQDTWDFNQIGVAFNTDENQDTALGAFGVNLYIIGHPPGPRVQAFSTVITTGYVSPWNAFALPAGTTLSGVDEVMNLVDKDPPPGSDASYDPGSRIPYFILVADNATVAPYVLMADASPSDGTPHPDDDIFQQFGFLSGLATLPTTQYGKPYLGLPCATNRAFMGCGRQQAAAVAFSGSQLVALAAEIPPGFPIGFDSNPNPDLPSFIAEFYGPDQPDFYIEGPKGIDNDIDTSFGITDDFLGNTCWDLTPYLYWTSSDPNIADVSNSPGRIGRIVRKGGSPAGTVTFTGSRLELNRAGQIGKPITVTCQYDFPEAPAATLTDLFVTPRFQTVKVGNQIQLYAVAQYSDDTNETLGSGVTWTSSDPALTVDADGNVTVNVAPAQPTVTITAQQGSVSSTAELTVEM